MKFEVLKSNHLKRNIIIGVIVVSVISAVVLNFTRAKYVYTDKMPLINGTVNYELADLNMMAVYLQDESATDGYAKSDTIPTEGYTFNDSMSYCTVDGVKDDSITLSYDSDTQMLTVSPMTTKGTKCYLYFDEQATIKDTLLTYYPTVLTRTSFSSTVTDTTTGTIYKSADSSQYDEDGEVYYFAGNPTDNWVSFAGFYWRIIRVNGDGSIRLIYQGISANTTGSGTQIGTSGFNSTDDDNMYVGYMYTENEVHGIGTSSTIKGVLDNWYLTNIQNAGYSSYIDDNAGFCGDRTFDPTSSGTGIGTSVTYYGAYYRLYTNKAPSYQCSNNRDLYTISNSNKGNRALTYPIGLVTADEVSYAGGVYGTSKQSYYLYTGQTYWTMTPYYYSVYLRSAIINIWSGGGMGSGNGSVGEAFGIRPVINLRSDVTISSGDGSSETPFVVS